MTDPSLTVQAADDEDLDRVVALLDENDLPSRDVRSKPDSFVVARADGTVVGAGGVETYGQHGLLRSVVVAESARGQGYGTALCDALEVRARDAGVEALYLLTTTAAPFFRDRGYDEVPREAAPSPVRRTTEFTDLCPASATCMEKHLR